MKNSFLLVVGLLGAVQIAPAVGIHYDISMLAAGTLNGVGFTARTVDFGFDTDTSLIQNLGGGIFVTPQFTGTFDLVGFASGTTTTLHLFSNQGATVAGINPGGDFLDFANAAYATYDLTTAIGPLNSPTPSFVGSGLGTSGGTLTLSSIREINFTATTAPEPATCALMAGAIGMFAMLRRRKSSL